MRLRKTLIDERSAWLERVQAQLFHHGVPKASGSLTPARCEQLMGYGQGQRSNSVTAGVIESTVVDRRVCQAEVVLGVALPSLRAALTGDRRDHHQADDECDCEHRKRANHPPKSEPAKAGQ
ncbi:MAG: hypothetical protein LC790_01125 [Actinobacteria bacterium]|nr:hypothetical protein [Actinomycetota bacterium]